MTILNYKSIKLKSNNRIATEAILKKKNVTLSYSNNDHVIFFTQKDKINDILNTLINFKISIFSVTSSKNSRRSFLEYND